MHLNLYACNNVHAGFMAVYVLCSLGHTSLMPACACATTRCALRACTVCAHPLTRAGTCCMHAHASTARCRCQPRGASNGINPFSSYTNSVFDSLTQTLMYAHLLPLASISPRSSRARQASPCSCPCQVSHRRPTPWTTKLPLMSVTRGQ